MTGLVVMHGAQDLHPRLLLGHLQHLIATNTTSLVVEAPPTLMLAVAMTQVMRAKNLV